MCTAAWRRLRGRRSLILFLLDSTDGVCFSFLFLLLLFYLDCAELRGVVLGTQVLDEGALRRLGRPCALHPLLVRRGFRRQGQPLRRQQRLQQLH